MKKKKPLRTIFLCPEVTRKKKGKKKMQDITFNAAAPSANQPPGNKGLMAIADSLKSGI